MAWLIVKLQWFKVTLAIFGLPNNGNHLDIVYPCVYKALVHNST